MATKKVTKSTSAKGRPAKGKPAPKKAPAKKAPKKTPAKKAPAKKAPAKKAPAKKAAPKKAAPKKAAPKKAPAAKKAPEKRSSAPIVRRDRAGHLSPRYARELVERGGGHSHEQEDSGFLRHARSSDDLAERLGEDFVASATSGEAEGEPSLNRVVPEESGGPFVITRAVDELADDIDGSNPAGSTREPFPTV